MSRHHVTDKKSNPVSHELQQIFSDKKIRTRKKGYYFEDRSILSLEFNLTLLHDETSQTHFGIQLDMEGKRIPSLSLFLKALSIGNSYQIKNTVLYDPERFCFQPEDDELVEELLLINQDNPSFVDESILIIPTYAWGKLLSILTRLPNAKLYYDDKRYEHVKLSTELISLEFQLHMKDNGHYEFVIDGLEELKLMPRYHCVLERGTIVHLENAQYKQLVNLIEMVENQQCNNIPIHSEQLPFFLEKVLPSLKKLGNLHTSDEISQQIVKTPLLAKMFLDRIKSRLLVGIEFHYDHIFFNPLESMGDADILLHSRDIVKENEILTILDESGFARTDGGYYLQNEALEYEFLYHILPKLQQILQTYATTAVRNRIIKSNSPPRIKVKMKKDRMNWLQFKFEMDGIRDSEIKEILQSLEEKKKYYRLKSGSLLSLEDREFQEIQRFLHTVPSEKLEELEKGLDMPLLKGIHLLDRIEENEFFTPEESFRNMLTKMKNPSSEDFLIPKSEFMKLKPYQEEGYCWLRTLAQYGFGGILADDMGLGKTVQSIAYISSQIEQLISEKRSVLIVSPSSVLYNWEREFKKFTPHIMTAVIDGDVKTRKKKQRNMAYIPVIITSYTMLRCDIHWYEKRDFHTVFFDEAQSFKNPSTQTAKAVKRLQANHRFALTGTPIENSPEELWSLFHVVFPELFRSLKEFSQLTSTEIARRSTPFILRRMKEDVLNDLPKKIETQEYVELYPEQKKLYGAYLAKLRHETLKHLDKDTLKKNRIRILAGLTRLRQICCHPSLFIQDYKESSAKLDKLLEIVEESLTTGRRVLIFSQFTSMLHIIGKELVLKGIPYFYLDGATPSEERVELCERFNLGENNFFLISLKAGGTGLNLTGADTVILYDIWWNPAVEEQATDRAHRIGQEKDVSVIKLLSTGTIEVTMDELQDKKRHLVEEIIDSKGSKESNLTEEDIRDLLQLE